MGNSGVYRVISGALRFHLFYTAVLNVRGYMILTQCQQKLEFLFSVLIKYLLNLLLFIIFSADA